MKEKTTNTTKTTKTTKVINILRQFDEKIRNKQKKKVLPARVLNPYNFYSCKEEQRQPQHLLFMGNFVFSFVNLLEKCI